jgi:hypothetical protein
MQRLLSATRRVRVPVRPAAAFSTEPMRVDPGIQKAFLKSVKPVPMKDGGSEKKKTSIEVKVEEKKMVSGPSVAPKATPNPAAQAADLFVKPDIQSNLQEFAPRICVVGVGGGGCNAINNMVARGLSGVEFICTNTDAQHLSTTLTDKRIQLGRTFTEGLGCGMCMQEHCLIVTLFDDD